jgi:hypothetical protein
MARPLRIECDRMPLFTARPLHFTFLAAGRESAARQPATFGPLLDHRPHRTFTAVLPHWPKTRVWGFSGNPSGRLSRRGRGRSMFTPGSRACAYKTASGRHEWVNRDPLGELGGINLFRFVRNTPLNAFDLFGLADSPTPYNPDNYNTVDPTKDVRTYNCAGLADRTYKPYQREEVLDRIQKANGREVDCSKPCNPGEIRQILWTYQLTITDKSGKVLRSRETFHTVAGRCNSAGELGSVPSKNGPRPLDPEKPADEHKPPRTSPHTDSLGKPSGWTATRTGMVKQCFCIPPAKKPE